MRSKAVLLLCLILPAGAQNRVTFEDKPALRLTNNKIELTVLPEGGAMAHLILVDDPEKLSPLWNPMRIAREAGQKPAANFYRGHFVCVDGFGPVSPEERDAGLPMHGEAHRLEWNLDSYQKQGAMTSAKFSVKLPLSQETFTRTFRIVDGENIVWVDSELENLLAFDRPAFWGEHATISAPFLQPGKVAVDMPVQKAKTKAYQQQGSAARQLESFRDFVWPKGPTRGGGTLDMRSAPLQPGGLEHITSLMDTSRKLVFVTALHVEKGLLIGWVFRREEYPWVQTWLSYPATGRMTRGMEFATQPFDLPRAEVLKAGPLFDTPVFRVLPAKSKIGSSFLMFFTRVPAGFQKVDDVQLEGGKLIIEDRGAGKKITLPASRAL